MKSERFSRRPPRLERLFQKYAAPIYFVTFCTFQRRAVLAEPNVHEKFVRFCERAAASGVAVGRYVIMPDHVHLFVRPHSFDLGRWIGLLKQCVGKDAPAELRWQEGFFDHLIRHDESYGAKWDYVRENPVRAGLVSEPEAWPFQGEIALLDHPS